LIPSAWSNSNHWARASSTTSREEFLGSCPFEECTAITWEEGFVIAQQFDDNNCLWLFYDLVANSFTQQFQRSGYRNTALHAVAPASAIVNDCRHSTQLCVGKGSCFPNVAAAPRQDDRDTQKRASGTLWKNRQRQSAMSAQTPDTAEQTSNRRGAAHPRQPV
jgi:hypothetical protein